MVDRTCPHLSKSVMLQSWAGSYTARALCDMFSTQSDTTPIDSGMVPSGLLFEKSITAKVLKILSDGI
jgi:hypothetical protein